MNLFCHPTRLLLVVCMVLAASMLTVILSGAHRADVQPEEPGKVGPAAKEADLQQEEASSYRIIAYAGGDMDYWH